VKLVLPEDFGFSKSAASFPMQNVPSTNEQEFTKQSWIRLCALSHL
jgi:hypothetical protein